MLSKQTTGILSAIVLIAGAAAAFGIEDLRFWARAGDLRQVAADSYANQLAQIEVVLIQARTQLAQCQAAGGDCLSIIQSIATLEQEKARLASLKAKLGG